MKIAPDPEGILYHRVPRTEDKGIMVLHVLEQHGKSYSFEAFSVDASDMLDC